MVVALRNLYNKVLSSIAFYPTIITFAFMFLALLLTSSFGERISNEFVRLAPNLSISDKEVAKTILSTLIGGILSLTVFSFSMVMVVLNQASTNFSPRLLPGLISDKKHQIILGIYTGTLLYCLVAIINLGVTSQPNESLGLSATIGALFGILCVILFVYFIHSISMSIQIDHIIDDTFYKSERLLNEKLEKQSKAETREDYWKTFCSQETGYFRGFQNSFQIDNKEDKEVVIELVPYLDQHVWEGLPLFRVHPHLDDDVIERIYENMIFSPDRHGGDNYLGGMIKLMEVAVKSMSPGINDPGTAIDALVKLGELLNKALHVYDKTTLDMNADQVVVIVNNAQALELFRLLIQPIRHYSCEDASVLFVLINSLKSIKKSHASSNNAVAIIDKELKAIRQEIERAFTVESDRDAILSELSS